MQRSPDDRRPRAWTRIVPIVMIAVLAGVLAWGADRPRWLGGPDGPQFGDFALQSATGTVRLSDHAGAVVVVYFGYASCPDVCPTTLQTVQGALKRLPPEDRARIAVLFVSVDPERDSPQRLAEYVAFFDPRMVGITGTEDQVRAVATDWGVNFAKVPQPGSALGYAVDHSGLLFLVGADGQMAKALPHGVPVEVLLADLRDVLRGPRTAAP